MEKGEFILPARTVRLRKKVPFFHLISGLTHADSGEILFEGKDLCKLSAKEWTHLRATQISYVLQGDSLLPNFTVLENICLPHRLCGEYPDLEKAGNAAAGGIWHGSDGAGLSDQPFRW